jgi:hypothetical protein
MKLRLFKEPVEELLIFFPQSPPKLPPLLDLLFQNLAKRKDRSSHPHPPGSKLQIPISLPTGRQANPKQILSSNIQITQTILF